MAQKRYVAPPTKRYTGSTRYVGQPTGRYVRGQDTAPPPPPPSSKGGGGLLHALARYSGAELVGNLAKDTGSAALQFGPGLYSVGHALVEGSGVTHPLRPMSAATKKEWSDLFHGHVGRALITDTQKKGTTDKELGAIFKGVGESYKNYYGSHVGSHLYNHPLQPLLDALTIADLGSTAGVRVGALSGERAALVSRSPRAFAKGEGPTLEDLSSNKPFVRGRQKAVRKGQAAAERAVGKTIVKLGGKERPLAREGMTAEFKRFGKSIQSEATRNSIEKLYKFEPYRKATKRLSQDEWTALHIRARDVHPTDLAQLWNDTPLGKAVSDPKIQKLVLNPTKRLLKAETEARKLSKSGSELLPLDELTLRNRPNLFKRQASEALGRQVKVIHGDPYYVPDVFAHEGEAGINPLNASGGGKGVPRKLGSQKRNRGVIALSGRLHMRSDVLGPEFLRRVKKIKHDEIHNALLHGSIPMTERELRQHYNGLPSGYEYLRDKPGTRVPPSLRTEGQTLFDPGFEALPAEERAQQLRMPTTSPTAPKLAAGLGHEEIASRLRTLDAQYKALVEKIIPEVSPYGKQVKGSFAKREQLYRNYSNSKAGRAKMQTVKQEEFTMAEQKLHDTLDKHANEPGLDHVRAMIHERQLLHDAVNARAEAAFMGERVPSLEELIPNPEDLHDSLLAQHGFSTRNPTEAKKVGDHYFIVPKTMSKAATGEFTRSNQFVHTFLGKPLSVWRAAVLGLRVGFLTNNLIGNSLLYATKTGGNGALRDLFGAILETHGPQVAQKILRNSATPPELRADLYKEFFPEQMRGTMGRTQSPSTSAAHLQGQKASETWRTVTGALPHATSVLAEELPRRALIRHFIRNSPEFKAVYRGLPKQTRSFEDAARQVLEGKGRTYQRMISKQVNNSLGDYLNLSPFERGVLRNTFPFYSWYKAIATVTTHLAVDTPLRANIIAQLGQVGKQYSDDLGPLPSYLAGAIGLGPGPGGTERAIGTQGMNPYATIEQLRRGLTSDVGSLGINPFFLAPAEALANLGGFGKPVSPGAIAGSALSDIGTNLPLVRLAHPKKPSKMYPRRGYRSELESFLGVPVKTYSKGEARSQAKQGR